MFIRGTKRFFAPDVDAGATPDEGDEPVEIDEGADEPDAGDEPDEGADEPDAGDEPDEGADEGDEPAPARKETRVQRLANENRKERDARIALETENRILRESAKPAASNDTARVRQEKLDLMEPAERKDFLRDEELAELRRGAQLTQIQLQDFADRSAYDTKAAANPVYARHKAWVEDTLVKERAAGRNPSRELLVRLKIGDEALRPSAKAKTKTAAKKAAAAGRVEGAKGKPLSGRSDASTARGGDDSVDALRQRILDREARGDM